VAIVACPYFYPTGKSSGLYWPFPQRLPLGAGFHGACTATAAQTVPSDDELRDFCNVGYAGGCGRLPAGRPADAIRFSVASETDDRLIVRYVCEREHAPVVHGNLEFDVRIRQFRQTLEDAVLLRQVECYVASYLERKAIGK
jgi:hypothetical protein